MLTKIHYFFLDISIDRIDLMTDVNKNKKKTFFHNKYTNLSSFWSFLDIRLLDIFRAFTGKANKANLAEHSYFPERLNVTCFLLKCF